MITTSPTFNERIVPSSIGARSLISRPVRVNPAWSREGVLN